MQDGELVAYLPLAVTPERAALFDFSAPLLETGGALYVRTGAALPAGLAALDGQIVVTPETGPLAGFIRRAAPGIKLLVTRDYESSLATLVAGGAAAAALNDVVGGRIALRLYPGQWRARPSGFLTLPFAVAVPKGAGCRVATADRCRPGVDPGRRHVAGHRGPVDHAMIEDVWQYPRPPALQRVSKRLRIVFAGQEIAATDEGWRVLETSHPPVYYLPRAAFTGCDLLPAAGRSFCEWKGLARYWSIRVGPRTAERAAWSYPDPTPAFADIADHLAVYAGPMDACFVSDEAVSPQPGGFYGGWVTRDLKGPFKGEPGTMHW